MVSADMGKTNARPPCTSLTRLQVRQEVYAAEAIDVILGANTLALSQLHAKLHNLANSATQHPMLDLSGAHRVIKRLGGFRRCNSLFATVLAFDRTVVSTGALGERLSLDCQMRQSVEFDATDHRDFIYGVLR
jgi:hypothetical protein